MASAAADAARRAVSRDIRSVGASSKSSITRTSEAAAASASGAVLPRERVGGERAHGVGERVHQALYREADGQRRGQGRVVEDEIGAHARIAPGGLLVRAGDPPQGSHLRAGVGGGNHREADLMGQTERLAEPDGRAAPHRHQRVRSRFGKHACRRVHHLRGNVNTRAIEDGGEDRRIERSQRPSTTWSTNRRLGEESTSTRLAPSSASRSASRAAPWRA